MKIAGIVLAGGQSRRMGGGDKCLRLLAGRPILAHIVERARPQVAALALNANGDPTRFAGYELPVVADSIADFAGPLAGVLAGLDWAAASMPSATHVASFAGDAPFLEMPYVTPLAPYERAEVVRMEVSVAELTAAGLEVHVPDTRATVLADVVLGQDGRAHAIRLVSDRNRSITQ